MFLGAAAYVQCKKKIHSWLCQLGPPCTNSTLAIYMYAIGDAGDLVPYFMLSPSSTFTKIQGWNVCTIIATNLMGGLSQSFQTAWDKGSERNVLSSSWGFKPMQGLPIASQTLLPLSHWDSGIGADSTS